MFGIGASLAFLAFLVSSTAARKLSARNYHEMRRPTTLNATESTINTLEKRGTTKYVFMHHIVGNWADDIRQIQAKGVDALALNMGGDAWERTQIASAYAAAAQLGTNFKLFISFDFTAMGCDLSDLVSRVKQFSSHPNQFRVEGKPMVSSFSGDCLGNAGWASLKAQTNAYLMPFVWGQEGRFDRWPSLDTWYCWGCAWPAGNVDKTTGDDDYYLSQLGPRYGTTISPWMYTHYNYKNWYQRGDNWLLITRWEQLMAMRDRLTFVELVSWNDYGESHYMGPIKGAQPDGTTWTHGFPHTAWYDLCQYYITAFKTGSYPAITQDIIYYWARPHPAAAQASSDSLAKPQGWDWTPDMLWAVVFATSPSTVTLTVGSSTQTFTNVPAGVSKLKIPLAPGKITVRMVKNGATVIQQTPSDYTYITNPVKYNFNVYVGAAKGVSHPNPPATPTTTTTTSPTPTPSQPSTSGWTSAGCFVDTSERLLRGSSTSQGGMTSERCIMICAAAGHTIAATEFGRECFCGSQLHKSGRAGTKVSAGECNMPCDGDAAQKCGAAWRANVYAKPGISISISLGLGL
ncbi:hypothetical protein D9615_008530 [Tricholomella constricta]|uniref:WSC domain-containing protein n=1 Tax=Tricholomella constricta TaxID=117010 RepID=A0A8H5H402_9AGAR|nr:hypothetical protein D9615_008530 [Tricholomella constricta]